MRALCSEAVFDFRFFKSIFNFSKLDIYFCPLEKDKNVLLYTKILQTILILFCSSAGRRYHIDQAKCIHAVVTRCVFSRDYFLDTFDTFSIMVSF